MECEWGGVRFLRFASAKMVDGEGKEILCKCGKHVCGGVFEKEAFVAYCEECHPDPIPREHRFVYIPQPGTGVPHICDDCVVKLVGDDEAD
jgi:hypothetical protein